MDAYGRARSGGGGGSNFCPETCSGEVINDPSVTCFTLKSNLISNLCLTSPPPRYQYYLQVKKEVLDGRLHCAVEQGIRLAGLAVQGETHAHTHTCPNERLTGLIDWSERERVSETHTFSSHPDFAT